MSYSNPYLIDFAPVFCGMLAEKQLSLGRVVLEVIDEEAENYSRFEPTDTLGVLEQIGSMLNYLTIYTERPQYFYKFAKRMYDENGLLVSLFPKGKWRSSPETEARGDLHHMVLDFEWKGKSRIATVGHGWSYVVIHKKPWKMAENLDISVPFGYNIVIVKSIQKSTKKPVRDRFEEAFYKK